MAALASRMAKELKKLEKQPPPGVSAVPKGGSVRELDVQLQGPPDSPYELGLFKLSVAVPDRCTLVRA
jgi:ubiquitin-conjugating enzyme E2 N